MMNLESRKAGKELGQREITERIIGAAMRVHKDLGPGFLEAAYGEALAVEFAFSGIPFVRQKAVLFTTRITRLVSTASNFWWRIESLRDIHFAVGRKPRDVR